MSKRLLPIKGFFPIVLLIGLFVAFAIIIFFCYGYTHRTPSEVLPVLTEEAPAEDGLSLSPVEQLSYRQDVARFLNVYFTQRFVSSQDKINFVKLEMERFTSYNITNDSDRVINERFLGDLRQLLVKMQIANANIETEESDLLKLRNEIK